MRLAQSILFLPSVEYKNDPQRNMTLMCCFSVCVVVVVVSCILFVCLFVCLFVFFLAPRMIQSYRFPRRSETQVYLTRG